MSEFDSRRSRAEELFDDYLTRRESGEAVDFEALCREQPELEVLLRNLQAGADALRRAQQESPSDASLAQRLRVKFGPGVDPDFSLEAAPKPESGSGSALLGQLRSEGPRGARYRVIGEIARGGMGAILKVWDGELRRTLAMKVVLEQDPTSGARSPRANPALIGRFLEEAQVTGQLDHPGIVPVHELGLDSDGRVYFTMRLVKGEDLRVIFEHVRSGHDGWNQVRALGVMLKVCEAMSFAHSKRVLHRDLKPANIMVGKFGEVYVMDWGLARVLGREDKHDLRLQSSGATSFSAVRTERREVRGESPDSPLITMDGDVVGTPSYMPLEQAQGRLDRLGEHSDVYAVGAMLYGLVAGEMPYVPRDARLSAHTILISVLNGPPRPLHELAPDTPAELIAIVDKAMAREIAERYPTMQALADDLRAYVEGRVVNAYEAGAWAEARKWIRRNRALAASLAAALALLVAGLWTSLVFKSRADEKAKEAKTQAEVATRKTDDVLSLSASKDLEELVSRAETLWPAHPAMIPEYEKWLVDAHALVDGSPADPVRNLKRRPSLEEHKAKLAEVRRRATAQSDARAKADRESHPRFAEWTQRRADLTWLSRMLRIEPFPSEAEIQVELAQQALPVAAKELDALAWKLVDPDKAVHGEEVKGLLLASRALAAASEAEDPGIRRTMAWAHFGVGQLDDAQAQLEAALDEAPSEEQKQLETELGKLNAAIERWSSDRALADRRRERDACIAETSELERIVNERRTWTFESSEDSWWQVQLSKLVSDLDALHDPRSGLMGDTLAEPFGWGVQKRLEFARTIQARSLEGPEAVKLWTGAIAAIAASPRYGGLKLSPQIGLVPIGEDPDSHLWEFAQLQTGTPPQRGADGRLILSDEMGLVFVLIPGGTFAMGAQNRDPSAPNFDLQTAGNETPSHEVLLRPYFLSKFEMTQGQWQRCAGKNPSEYGPDVEIMGRPFSWLHPVESVSWLDCMEEMRRLGLSLPSEAQWENGCRAGTSTPWSTGKTRESLRGMANIADRTAADAGAPWSESLDWPDLDDGWLLHAPVGDFPPNPFGIHEVHGNVNEWCLDGYDGLYYRTSPGKDPVAPTNGALLRVFRGGCFSYTSAFVRSAARRSGAPDYRNNLLGLRPARALAP